MNTYEIIMTVLAIVFGGLSLYISGKKNVIEVVAQYIDEAEETYKDSTKSGGEKFEWVVDRIISIIPIALKPFVTRELVETVVQKVFDVMESYACKQLDRVLVEIQEKTNTASNTTIPITLNAENTSTTNLG